MKLTLPKGIRNALLACICASAPIGSTLATGSLVGGAFFVSISGQAMAEDETTGDTTEDDSTGVVTDSLTYDGTEGTTAPTWTATGEDEGVFSDGDSASFTAGSTTVTLGSDVTAGTITVNSGATADIVAGTAPEGDEDGATSLTVGALSNSGSLTLNADTTVTGSLELAAGITNNAELTLTGATVTVSSDALTGLTSTQVTPSGETNGFVTTTYTGLVVNGESGSIAGAVAATVGSNSATLNTDGSLTVADTTGIYYVNSGTVSYNSATMGTASGFYVNGATLSFGGSDWGKAITLHNGTVEMQPQGSLKAGSTVVLVSDTDTEGNTTYSTNKISAVNSTFSATVSGTGNLELNRYNTNNVFYIAGTIQHTGNLTISNGATVTGGSINNIGTVTLLNSSLNYSYIGSNVTGISLNGGTLDMGSFKNLEAKMPITLLGGENLIKGEQMSVFAAVTGMGNLTLERANLGYWAFNISNAISHLGDLTLKDSSGNGMSVTEAGNLNNTGAIYVSTGTVNFNSGSTIGSNVTKLSVNGGTLNVNSGSTISTKNIELSSGALSFADAYTVGTGGTLSVSGGTLTTTGGLALGGGKLTVGAGYTLGNDITVSAASELTGGKNSVFSGKITGTGGNLTVSASSDSAVGEYNAFYLSGNIDLGSNSLIVDGGVVSLGNAYGTANSSTLTMKDIQVKSGTLQIYRQGGTANTGIVLDGGNLFVQAMDNGPLSFGTLDVKKAATIGNMWNSSLAFSSLTGSGDLGITKASGSQSVTFTTLNDYTGTLTVGSGASVTINSAAQSTGTAIISGATTSSTNFVKTGEGSVVLGSHTANAGFTVKEGTLTVGTLTLGTNASLALEGGVFGVTNALETGVATTLGAVTLGTTLGEGDAAVAYTGAITLTGDIHFTNKATTNVALTLAGDISLSTEAMASVHPTGSGYKDGEGAEVTTNGNGYLVGTYTLVTSGTGGSVVLKDYVTTETEVENEDGTTSTITSTELAVVDSKTITVGNTTAKLTVTDGTTASFTLTGDTSGTYYVNLAGTAYNSNMSTAATLYVNSGADLTFTETSWSKNLDLAGGTVTFARGSMNNSEAKTITLHSTDANGDGSISASELSQNKLSMTNSTLNSTITGTGDLVLERFDSDLAGGSPVFYLNSNIQHVGNLTLKDGVLMGGANQNGAGSINNTGKLTLDNNSIHYGYVGSKVTAIELKNGLLESEGKLVTHNIISTATDGTYTNKVYISGGSNPMVSTISGDGDLTIEVAKGYDSHFYGKTSDLTADLTLAGEGTVNIGHSGSGNWGNPIVSHAGDLIINGATVNMGGNAGMSNESTIANTGNLIISSGALNVGTYNTNDSATPTINLEGSGNATGKIVINGTGAMTLTQGSVTAKGLEMTSGTLTLGMGITLTGGVTDADGTAVDTLVLTGGTLNANAGTTLAYGATLGAITVNSSYTVQEVTGSETTTDDDGNETTTDVYSDVTKYHAVTLGAADATTTITGTVQNNAALTINGKITVSGLSNFSSTATTLSEGQSGFAHTTYTLVNGAEGSSLALGNSTVTIADTLGTGLVAGSNIVTSGGSASIATAETTYHVATDNAAETITSTSGLAYSAISGNDYGISFSTISMEGGVLNIAAGDTVSQNIILTTDSHIFASSRSSGNRAAIEGDISGDYDLTITSNAKNVSGNSHGDFAVLAGNVNLGSHDLTINGIVRLGDTNESSAANTASIKAGSIVVSKGSTLEIQRVGAALGAGEDGVATTGLTLAGSTLHLQNVIDANSSNGAGTMAFGTLTVNAATDDEGNILSSTITEGYWGGSTSFTSLKGDGNLTLSSNVTTTIGKLDGYTGKLTLSAGNLNFTDALTVSGSSLQVDGGTLNAKGGLAMTGGSITINGGTVKSEAGISLTGGELIAGAAFALTGDMTLGGVTLTSSSATDTITLGAGGTTSFVGTVTNAGALTLSGALVVEDASKLTHTGTVVEYGKSGYNSGNYYLVNVESTESAQDDEVFTPTLIAANNTVTVDGVEKDLTVDGGTAYFSYSDTTYHVGTDVASIAYSTITGIEGVTFKTIALDGGKLTLAAGESVSQKLELTANSTLSSAGTSGSMSYLSADIDLAGKTLSIADGYVRLGNSTNENDEYSISAGTIKVNSDATLDIYRQGGEMTGTNIELAGGTLHQQVIGTNGGGTLSFGELQVTHDASRITGKFGGMLSFTALTGEKNLTIEHIESTNQWARDVNVTLGTLKDYTGTLTLSTRANVTLTDGIISSGTVALNAGTLKASSGLEIKGGTLSLGGGSLSLGEGHLTLTSGTLNAAVNSSLSNVTLAGGTLAGSVYEVTNEDESTSSALRTLTLTGTTFNGTVENAGAVTLAGTISVNDITELEGYTSTAYTAGTTGYGYTSATLVKAATDTTVAPTLTLADGVTANVAGISGANISVADGGATITAAADGTYHIAADETGLAGVSYTTSIAGNEHGITFATISLEGGVLNADADIAQNITVASASGITATGEQSATISGAITAAGESDTENLTLNGGTAGLTLSGALSADSLTISGGSVVLGGNTSIGDGKGSITVEAGRLTFGEDKWDSNTLNVSNITVASGAEFRVNHAASNQEGGVFLTAPTLELQGGTLRMEDTNNYSSEYALVFGALKVTGEQASSIESTYAHTTFFKEVTGSGDLNINPWSNNDSYGLWGNAITVGINTLKDYEGTLTMADSNDMKLYLLSANQGAEKSGTVVGTTYSSAADGSFTKLGEGALALDKHVAEGGFTVAAGTLSVNDLTVGAYLGTTEEGDTVQKGGLTVSGGTLNIGTGGITGTNYVVTTPAETEDGEATSTTYTPTITLAGGTLGATGASWSTDLATKVTGNAAIDTAYTTMEGETETTKGAAITLGDITVEADKTLSITGTGSVTAGALSAAGATVTLGSSAGLGVTKDSTIGTWTLSNSTATQTITVAKDATLTINGVTNGGSTNFSEAGSQNWWSLLSAGTGEGTIVINSNVNTSNNDTNSVSAHTISGNYKVNGDMLLNAYGAAITSTVASTGSLAVSGDLYIGNTQTVNVEGDVTVVGNINIGRNSGAYANHLNISGGTTQAAGIAISNWVSNSGGHTVLLDGGSLILGSGGITSSTTSNTINLANGTLGASADWSTDTSTELKVTLGSANGLLTIASGTRTETTTVDGVETPSTVANVITLAGTTSVAGEVVNTGSLVLSGAFSIASDSVLSSLDKVEGADTSYSYTSGKSGYLTTSYYLIKGQGDSATLTVADTATMAVGTNTGLTLSTDGAGSAIFSAQNGSIYYVNENMAYADDTTMKNATTIVVTGTTTTVTDEETGATDTVTTPSVLTLGDLTKGNFVLNNGTLAQQNVSLGSGTITLDGGTNTLSMANCTMAARVKGTGNLVLERAVNASNDFFINSTIDNDGDVTLTMAEGASGNIVFNSGGKVANTGSVYVTEGTTAKLAGADFSAATVVNSGVLQVTEDTTLKTYEIGADITTNTSTNGKLSIDAGKSLTITDLSAYQFNVWTNSTCSAFWTLVEDAMSFNSGGGTVVLQTNESGTGTLEIDYYGGQANAEHTVYGNFKVAGDLQVSNGGQAQKLQISGQTSSLTVTGDATFLNKQQVIVDNGGSFTVEGNLILGHTDNGGDYYSNIIIGTSETAKSASVTLGGLVFQNYYAGVDLTDNNYLRLGNGALTFVDNGTDKAQVTIGSNIPDLEDGDVVAKLELDGGPLKTGTTVENGVAVGWEVNKHIDVELVGVQVDTSAGGTITFNGNTEFWGTVSNIGTREDELAHGLVLNGALSVAEGKLSSLTRVEGDAPMDADGNTINGFGSATYYLVQAAEGSNASVTLGEGITTVNVAGMGDKDVTASGGNLSFSASSSVYQVNVNGEALADYGNYVSYDEVQAAATAAGVTTTAISLNNSEVGFTIAGYSPNVYNTEAQTVVEDIIVNADNATVYGGVQSVMAGDIMQGSTAGNLTLHSYVDDDVYRQAVGVGVDATHASFALRGDINLGEKNLTIANGWVSFGQAVGTGEYDDYGDEIYTQSTNSITANSLTVSEGATLEIYHKADSADSRYITLEEGITLDGGRIFVRTVEDAGAGNSLHMGALTVAENANNKASSLGVYWNGQLVFDSLKGSGDLNIMGPDGNPGTYAHGFTFSEVDYSGTLTISQNTDYYSPTTGAIVNVESGTLGGDVNVKNGTLNFAGDTLGAADTTVTVAGSTTMQVIDSSTTDETTGETSYTYKDADTTGGTLNMTGGTLAGSLAVTGGTATIGEGASLAGAKAVSVSDGTLTLSSTKNIASTTTEDGATVAAPAVAVSGTGTLNFDSTYNGWDSDDEISVQMNGGTVALNNRTVKGSYELNAADAATTTQVTGGGALRGDVSGKGSLSFGASTEAYHLYGKKNNGSETMNMEYEGNFTVQQGATVYLGNGNSAANLKNTGDVTVSGTLNMVEGSVASTGTATVGNEAGTAKLLVESGTTFSAAELLVSGGTVDSTDATMTLGKVTVENGSFTVGTLSGTTSLAVAADAAIKFANDTIQDIDSMILGSNAKLTLSAGTLSFTANEVASLSFGKTAVGAEAGIATMSLETTVDNNVNDYTYAIVDVSGWNEDDQNALLNGSKALFDNAAIAEDSDTDYVYIDFGNANSGVYALGAGTEALANGVVIVSKVVPEPTTTALGLLALAGLAARRRRK